MVRTRTLTAFLMVGLTLLLAPGSARGDTLPFVTLEFPPYNYQSNGEVSGVSPEIVKRIVDRMGHTATFEIQPWERAQEEAARGRYAGIFTLTKSYERMKDFKYTAPLAYIKDVFFKRREKTISWRKLSDLAGYEIGASAAYNYADVFLDAMEDRTLNVQLVHSETPERLHLRKLQRNRIDLAICELRLCEFLITKNAPEFTDVDYIERPIGPVRTFHFAFAREWPGSEQLVKQFNRHLYQIHDRGLVRDQFRKHGSIFRIDQPLKDFARDLLGDVKMHFRLAADESTDHEVDTRVNERLLRVLENRYRTLGLRHGPMLVIWIRNGSFSLVESASGVDTTIMSSSRVEQGAIRESGDYTLGVVPLPDDRPDDWSINYEKEKGGASDGGFLVFESPDEVRRSLFRDLRGERIVTPLVPENGQ